MIKAIARLLIKFYQFIFSPDKGVFKNSHPVCCFWPTCSDYSLQAIEKFGAIKGGWLGIKRILRCHPFNEGGCDPVPTSYEILTKARKYLIFPFSYFRTVFVVRREKS